MLIQEKLHKKTENVFLEITITIILTIGIYQITIKNYSNGTSSMRSPVYEYICSLQTSHSMLNIVQMQNA